MGRLALSIGSRVGRGVGRLCRPWPLVLLVLLGLSPWVPAAELPAFAPFRTEVYPILARYCSECHFDGMNQGGVAFDEFQTDAEPLTRRALWSTVLKYVRAGLMPPADRPRPSPAEQARLENWIKFAAFGIDPHDPDPGQVTVRRLNRIEYRNTVRDLTGVDFESEAEFPPDDTGHGFDTLGDVLTLPPMLLEKYLAAARSIAAKATATAVPAESVIPGRSFVDAGATAHGGSGEGSLSLSCHQPASIAHRFRAEHAGHYRLVLDLTTDRRYPDGPLDVTGCRVVFKADGHALLRRDFTGEEGKPLRYEVAQTWPAGAHELTLELLPLAPERAPAGPVMIGIDSVTVRGPLEERYWIRPKTYVRFFPRDAPLDPTERRSYARELLGRFARKAYRRPVDDTAVDRLVALAESVYGQPGKTFEAGIAQAMVAVLSSPRFLFREEGVEPIATGHVHPFIDEHALASRLSYFLWSSMPDDELSRLADEGGLRANLAAQVRRMLADPRLEALAKNFTGQWLQARDIETISIDARAVLAREASAETERPRTGPVGLTGALRSALRQETEMVFAYIVREDRSLLELIDGNYTFLNERLARHYAVPNVEGPGMRRVTLPPDSPRGGILTQGTVLAVTSNPTRTSPVKRGLFILDAVLGTPPPPPPPDITPLVEDTGRVTPRPTPTLRETLALHRGALSCRSCHDRLDPLGLALEQFNALGMWREAERGQPIDTAGTLMTGERFTGVRELKHLLARGHRRSFFRTLTEKLLVYALGRGLEYYDAETVDRIVDRLERDNGRPTALLMGVIESTPFQKRRNTRPVTGVHPLPPAGHAAGAAWRQP